MQNDVKLEVEGGKEVDREQYQRLVGKLIYLHQAKYCLCCYYQPMHAISQGKTSGSYIQNSQILEEYS